eukprot:SM000074S21681  [mRNA]  locus=s74:425929:428759:+ [translate_table: standard]
MTGQMPNGGGGPQNPEARGARATVDKGADFANYFCTYAFLYHQKEMLSDRVRMRAYHRAVFANAAAFAGKVVLDVGTGSGILAIWAAQAGARKVYAVEATNMAQHAELLAASNGVSGIVEVIQGSIEDVTLPEKVDVIISEWMGYFLVRESMLDSVIIARDRWLKPGGAMYPSHARMWLAPTSVQSLADQKLKDYEFAMGSWRHFLDETQHEFGVDMGALSKAYRLEQQKYFLQVLVLSTGTKEKNVASTLKAQPLCMPGLPRLPFALGGDDSRRQGDIAISGRRGLLTARAGNLALQTSSWQSLYPEQIIGTPAVLKEFDCHKVTLADIERVSAEFSLPLSPQHSTLSGFAGWFDVHFRGSQENPAGEVVELSTAPSANETTHWGQQAFVLHPPVQVKGAATVSGLMDIARSKSNHRLMDVKVVYLLDRRPPSECTFFIE